MTRLYRTHPETDTLAADALRLANSIDLAARSSSTTTKAVLERAEEQARQLAIKARDLRMALRGELQRIRADERAMGRERVVALVTEAASIGEVMP